MIIQSNLDGNGRETMCMCVKCSLNSSDICTGTQIVLVNDHKRNNYLIYESVRPMGYKELEKGKDEVLVLSEFEKWLELHGYKEDERACKEAREHQQN